MLWYWIHGAVGDNADHPVDGIRPQAGTPVFSSSPDNGTTYGIGETIEITIPFDENVAVSGTPTIVLDLGFDRTMELTSGSGTDPAGVLVHACNGRHERHETGAAVGHDRATCQRDHS